MKIARPVTSPEVSPSAPVDDAPTRERVASAIMTNGPSTAVALAEQLDLTPAAVRRHLDQLLGDGVVEARDQRVHGQRGRGRPAKVFVITDPGRDHFGHTYDALASDALRYLRNSGGETAVRDFARARLAELEQRCTAAARDAKDPVSAVAQALTSDGYAASVESNPSGEQICQHHCPVSHVAHEFPELCDAETEMLARVLGTHVQRLATIAHGDGICTTHIPIQQVKKVTQR
ncbi:MAG: helix-turn-helix transcriptional regulator [Aeromicrobium sp.]